MTFIGGPCENVYRTLMCATVVVLPSTRLELPRTSMLPVSGALQLHASGAMNERPISCHRGRRGPSHITQRSSQVGGGRTRGFNSVPGAGYQGTVNSALQRIGPCFDGGLSFIKVHHILAVLFCFLLNDGAP